MHGFQFRPSLPGILITFFGVTLFTSLMFWQIDRADQKRVIHTTMESRIAQPVFEYVGQPIDLDKQRFRKVELSGEFLNDSLILLDNVIRNGKPGYDVIVPFKLTGSDKVVLVDRGWIKGFPDRRQLPTLEPVYGIQKISGRIDQLRSIPVIAGDQALIDQEIRWSWLDLKLFRRETGLAVPAFLINQDASEVGELVSEPINFQSKVGMHIGYAIQWGAFALIALGVFIGVNLKKKENA